ncbi:hypothetical protein [Arthrobacter sulfonylureivorans]|uniref:Uncharacterized protein n=1 Tax=Arthrobacter sulfonylureivorans TaxID=2486855 RepID=A0ABY3WBS1_9MICC|nr:hypothetical protein [Arthrobacter sulfonylureivorans]UNK47802.1 hypothetical protein MNQ99_18945 [Arthrobacter sulfonylureivorans]
MNQIVVAGATLLASVGGYLLAGLNERRRDERTMQRELRLRVSEREAQLDDDRHALQRETLLALQDAVQAMARYTGQAMHFDHMQARQGKYTQLPNALSDDTFANLIKVRSLASRILDSGVRDAVDGFIGLSARLSTSPKDLEGLVGDRLEDHALAKLVELDDGYAAVSRMLGEAARREIAWQPADRTSA